MSPFSILKNEKGFVLIFAMLVLMVLVLIGISATSTTTIEIQIAANDKFHKSAFYNADGGIYTTPKVISAAILDDANPVVPTIAPFLVLDANFYKKIMGFIPADAAPELTSSPPNIDFSVDVVRAGQEIMAGGGAEFASGSSGVGAGSTGGVAVLYDINSNGAGQSNAVASITARYRKVPGTAGGL